MDILNLIQYSPWILGVSMLLVIVCVTFAGLKSVMETRNRKSAEYERQKSYEAQLQNKYKRFNQSEKESIYRTLLKCHHAQHKAEADLNKAIRLENRGEEAPISLLLGGCVEDYLIREAEDCYKIKLESEYLSLDIGYLKNFLSTNKL